MSFEAFAAAASDSVEVVGVQGGNARRRGLRKRCSHTSAFEMQRLIDRSLFGFSLFFLVFRDRSSRDLRFFVTFVVLFFLEPAPDFDPHGQHSHLDSFLEGPKLRPAYARRHHQKGTPESRNALPGPAESIDTVSQFLHCQENLCTQSEASFLLTSNVQFDLQAATLILDR